MLGLTVLAGSLAAADAQTQMVERSVKAAPNKDTQIGVYLNVLPDCSSGPLPTIRLASPQIRGRSHGNPENHRERGRGWGPTEDLA